MLRSGRPEDATGLLQGWLDKHGDDMVATEQMSEINIATGKFDEATKGLERLLKQKPHDPVALNNLAWVYQQQGNDAKAQALARQAYVLAPGPQTADTLGWILTSSGNAKSGVVLLRQASSEGTSDPRILYHYAVALKDSGDRNEAKKQLETVVANQSAFKEKVLAQKLLEDLAEGT
jgi:Flp pilus assembly protein TadD